MGMLACYSGGRGVEAGVGLRLDELQELDPAWLGCLRVANPGAVTAGAAVAAAADALVGDWRRIRPPGDAGCGADTFWFQRPVGGRKASAYTW
ncbi:hypothetical protein GCM10009661_45060 [Catellatospora chokoriensis]|uniref:Uncharacterized protein n=1 Tax=Catellatospora chokoriensis TaxID=310353 RepID=A0A8J3K003_9ACTN|nr:hypothetical protein Cch02nite_49730 [Catellatospora chokoriensis]